MTNCSCVGVANMRVTVGSDGSSFPFRTIDHRQSGKQEYNREELVLTFSFSTLAGDAIDSSDL